MNPDKINQLREAFEAVSHEQDGLEYWFARDLQNLLEYAQWRNFLVVIEKAMEACKNSQQDPEDHFVGVNKMIELGMEWAEFFQAEGIPQEINSQQRSLMERLRLVEMLDEQEQGSLFTILDAFVSKKKLTNALTNVLKEAQ